jgi:predicted nucleic acid-binding protein
MILYLDTSSFVPLFVDEPGSGLCRQLWDAAQDVVSTRLLWVETYAALAQAHRLGRLTADGFGRSKQMAEFFLERMMFLDVDKALAQSAARFAEKFALRAFDAIHCAAAYSLETPDLVAASGDRKLVNAWLECGLNATDTAAGQPA